MKQTDNRQKEVIQLKAQKGHLLSFRDKSHIRQEVPPRGGKMHGEGPKPVSSPQTPPVTQQKAGRNDPCPCGSGKKYKKCCLAG